MCTTENPDGTINVAPMGPVVNPELTSFLFRPFQSSTTYANLKRTGYGVFHVTDDVELLAQAAVGQIEHPPRMIPAIKIPGAIIANSCRWYEFRVTEIDDSQPRTEVKTEILHTGFLRDFFGFNRAKHAVLEAAILATRLHLIPAEEIKTQLAQLRIVVEKTCGPAERRAFDFLSRHIQQQLVADLAKTP